MITITQMQSLTFNNPSDALLDELKQLVAQGKATIEDCHQESSTGDKNKHYPSCVTYKEFGEIEFVAARFVAGVVIQNASA